MCKSITIIFPDFIERLPKIRSGLLLLLCNLEISSLEGLRKKLNYNRIPENNLA